MLRQQLDMVRHRPRDVHETVKLQHGYKVAIGITIQNEDVHHALNASLQQSPC